MPHPDPRVLICDAVTSGHHLHYVRVLSECILELGCEVHWALPQGVAETREFEVHLHHLSERVTLHDTLPNVGLRGFSSWRALATDLLQLTRTIKPARVMLPYAGGLAAGLGSRLHPWPFRECPVEGLLMRGGWAYPTSTMKQRLRHRVNLGLIRRVPWDRLHVLDPLVHDATIKRHPSMADSTQWQLIPEPVEPVSPIDTTEARRRLGLPEDGRWLVVTGMQDERKGSDRLLRAFANADVPGDARLLLAGRANDTVRGWIDGPGRSLAERGALHVIDRYLTEQEHDWALQAADVMVAPHVCPVGSSGLLVRAAALGKPVLASDYGWVGWATERFALGRTVDVTDHPAYTRAVQEIFQQPPTRGNGFTQGFVRFHTLANHRAHWTHRLRKSMGIEDDPAFVSWDDALPGFEMQ